MTDAGLIWTGAMALAGVVSGVAASLLAPARLRPVVVTLFVVAAIAVSGRTPSPWLSASASSSGPVSVAEMRAADPDAFDALAGRLSTMRGAWGEEAAMRADALGFTAAAHVARAQKLSDDELMQYLSLTLAQFDAAVSGGPALCAALLGALGPEALAEADPPQAFREAAAQAGALIFASDLPGGEILAPDAFDAVAQTAVAAVVAEHGSEGTRAAFSALRTGAGAPPETCAVFASYLRAIEALPMPERARFYRTALGQG